MKKLISTLLATTLQIACSGSAGTTGSEELQLQREAAFTMAVAKVSWREGESIQVEVRPTTKLTTPLALIWEVTESADRLTEVSGTVTLTGEQPATFQLGVKSNALYDGEATVRIRVREQNGAALEADLQLAILDDDPMPFVFAGDASGQRGARIEIPVTLSSASNRDVTIPWSTQDATAKAGRDYSSSEGILVIPAGATQGVVTIATLPGAQAGKFLVQLLSADTAQIANSTATATIESGGALETTLSFVLSQTIVREGTSQVNVQIASARAIDRNITLLIRATGSAAAPDDYTANSFSLEIPAGQTSATFSATINDDGLFEHDENVTLELVAANNASFGEITRHTIVLEDNDAMPNLSINDAQGTEGQNLTFSVALDRVSGVDTVLSFRTESANAKDSDYAPQSGTITIVKGSTVATIQVATIDDALFENREKFHVVITSVNGAVITRGQASGMIFDNDQLPTVQFEHNVTNVRPIDSEVQVDVVLSVASGATTSIPFQVSGDAVPGEDHNLLNAVVTIPAGSRKGTITFNVFHRGPPRKTMVITLLAPNNAELGGNRVHTVNLAN